MVQLLGALSILVSISFYMGSAQAQSWDLGYTNNSPVVEEIPDSIDGDRKADIIEVSDINEDQEKPPVPSRPAANSITKISTQRNTYGVETVEKPGLKLFLSPIAGLTSVTGNETVNVAPQYTYGGRVGLLVSDNMMIESGYTHALMNTSVPLNGISGIPASDVFALKQNTVDAGAKFFFLGRESRFRPFVGGAFAYSTSTLNYTPAYAALMGSTNDFKMKQLQGMGQIGAEVAITRGIVATAAFKLNGILSNSGDNTDASILTPNSLENSKSQAGSSLSHSATYTASVGVGVYF